MLAQLQVGSAVVAVVGQVTCLMALHDWSLQAAAAAAAARRVQILVVQAAMGIVEMVGRPVGRA